MRKVILFLLVGLLLSATSQSQVHTSKDYKVTILSTMLADSRGVGEWGFAALVEVDGNKILFDTGAKPETVLNNAQELGINLSQVEHVYLSHNHWDHVGGLITLRKNLMKQNPKALSKAHVGDGIFLSRPRGSSEGNYMLRVKNEYLELGGEFIQHGKSGEIFPGVWNTGPIVRTHNERNWSGSGTIVTPNGRKEDNIPEDQSIAISTDKGWILLSGCGHAGIINTMDHIREKIDKKPILTAIGGFHLLRATDETLAWTAKQMQRHGIKEMIGAHCTGINAVYMLRSLLEMNRKTAVVGTVGATYSSKSGLSVGIVAR